MIEGWRRRAWPLALFALPSIVVLGVGFLVSRHGFDGLYGQDAFAYHAYATGPLREALLGARFPPDFGWPPGYPILVALTSIGLGGSTIPGQLVSLLAGAAVPISTVLLARDLRPASPDSRLPAAIPGLAGLFVAMTPHLWQSSAVVMSDTTALALATFGAWALVRYASTGRARWAALSAGASSCAIVVRWIYVLAALPSAVAGVVLAWRAGAGGGRVVTVAHVATAAVVGAVVLSPALLPIAGALASGETPPFTIQFGSHGWDPGNALRSSFSGADGGVEFALPMALFYLLEPARPYYLGPIFALLAVVGGVVVLGRATIPGIATLIGWPLLMLAFLVGDTYQNTRFALAMLPPVAILAAVGAVEVGSRVWRLRPPSGRRLSIAFGCAVIVGLLAMFASAVGFTDAFITRQAAERSAIRRLTAQVPPGARLIAFGATLAIRHDGRPDALELYDQRPDALVAVVGDGRPTYLLVPAEGLDEQWAAAPPGLAFGALRDGPGLSPVDQAGAYRLLVVGSPSGDAGAYRTA